MIFDDFFCILIEKMADFSAFPRKRFLISLLVFLLITSDRRLFFCKKYDDFVVFYYDCKNVSRIFFLNV